MSREDPLRADKDHHQDERSTGERWDGQRQSMDYKKMPSKRAQPRIAATVRSIDQVFTRRNTKGGGASRRNLQGGARRPRTLSPLTSARIGKVMYPRSANHPQPCHPCSHGCPTHTIIPRPKRLPPPGLPPATDHPENYQRPCLWQIHDPCVALFSFMSTTYHNRKQEFCRQPKLTANIWKADGKGFAVSSTTSNLLSAHQSAVSCFAVSSRSTDGKAFAVSLFVLADGKAARTTSSDLTPVGWVNGVHCRQLAAWLTAKPLPGPTCQQFAVSQPTLCRQPVEGRRQSHDQMVTATAQIEQAAATCPLCRQLANGNAFAVSKLTAKLSVSIFLICFSLIPCI